MMPNPRPTARGTALEPIITRLIGEKDLTGSLGELTALYDLAGLEAGAVLLVGLGPRRRFEPGAAFSAGFALAKRLAGKRRDDGRGCSAPLPIDRRVCRLGPDRGGHRRHAWARGAEDRSGSACV